ncbi:MAG: MBL fold metallo-hydrolase [Alphaproteobacteria bacterium]|nr:MBL fold metallo-hydrolase [Alphaproteobacteria bacterium]
MAETKITFFDVGHGSCTHIQTPNGKNILVDIGGSDDFSPAYHLVNIGQISQLDALVITHPHEDHYHDIMNLERYGISPRVLSRAKSAFPIDRTKFDVKDRTRVDYINAMNSSYTKAVPPEEDPFSEYVNGGLKWQAFSPDKNDQDLEDPNTFSKVYVLSFGECKVVLTGDNNKEILVKMMTNPEFVAAVKNADFLLAPHHGRTTDFCPEFFAVVNPRATIISDKRCEHDSQLGSSCAYNNGRGIWLNGESRHVLTTRKDGNIVLRIDQFGNYSFDSWHHAA